MTKRRPGLAEAVLLVEFVALATWCVAPAIRARSMRREADRAASDLRIVRMAALAQHTQAGIWAEDAGPGQVPASLSNFLPPGFVFDRGAYLLDWDRWRVSGGTEPASTSGEFIGLSVSAKDPRLTQLIIERADSRSRCFVMGRRVTYVVDAPRTLSR